MLIVARSSLCHGSTFGSDFVVLVDFVVLLDRTVINRVAFPSHVLCVWPGNPILLQPPGQIKINNSLINNVRTTASQLLRCENNM
jgi:hypothetical protein